MRRNLWLVAFAAAATLWSCGPSDKGGGAGPLTNRDKYPEAPYGLKKDQVIADVAFEVPEGSFSLNDVFKDPHNRVLLLTTTAGWCTACLEEQPKLVDLYKEYSGHGLMVVAALFQDQDFNPATLDQVQSWRDNYKLPYPLVLDQPFRLGAYYNTALTPMNMLVDVDTMKILKITTGFDEQVVRAVIEANLDL